MVQRPRTPLDQQQTPQPQHIPARHISEPPPLNSLISNPVFIHAPAQTQEPVPAPTLGSLVDSTRAVSRFTDNSLASDFLTKGNVRIVPLLVNLTAPFYLATPSMKKGMVCALKSVLTFYYLTTFNRPCGKGASPA